MGRKKKKSVKPWCWYCNREFDDHKILIQHQKAKHFKCQICHRKLFTGPGLSIHCNQVHKEKLDKIPNALPSRCSTIIDIYGMSGVPEVDLIEHDREKLGLEDDDDDDDIPEKVQKMEAPYYPPLPPALPFLTGHVAPPGPFAMGAPHPMGAVQYVPLPPPPPPPVMPTPPQPVTPKDDKSPSITPKATFPAYSSPSLTTKGPTPKVPRPVAPNGGTVELIHPEDDLSLEEIRAELPRYKRILEAANTTNIPIPPPAAIPIPGSNFITAPNATMMYPVANHAPQLIPMGYAPGFVPQAFNMPIQPPLPRGTQMMPWGGVPHLRF